VGAERIAELAARRDALAAALRELGIAVPEAQGNFVWIPETAPGERGVGSALALAADFAEAGTLVRPFAGHGVRVSVGEAESVPEVLRIVAAHLAP
jgi:histidinol-phosphate aminotransferase